MIMDEPTAVSMEASGETVERRRMHLFTPDRQLGGAISPIADPAAKHGYRFEAGGVDVERDLTDLAKLDAAAATARRTIFLAASDVATGRRAGLRGAGRVA
jgi:hypothetical protein